MPADRTGSNKHYLKHENPPDTREHVFTLWVIKDLERSQSLIFNVYPVLYWEGVEALKEIA